MPFTINGTTGLTFNDTTTQSGGLNLINNTGAGADLTLQMGQTAYVNISGQTSVPLRIATSANQIYELNYVATAATLTTNIMYLLINNANGSPHNTFQTYTNSAGTTAGNFLSADTSLRMSIGGTAYNFSAKLFTQPFQKCALVMGRDSSAATGFGYMIQSTSTDTSTAWTSLGTLTCATAFSGIAYIRRIG